MLGKCRNAGNSHVKPRCGAWAVGPQLQPGPSGHKQADLSGLVLHPNVRLCSLEFPWTPALWGVLHRTVELAHRTAHTRLCQDAATRKGIIRRAETIRMIVGLRGGMMPCRQPPRCQPSPATTQLVQLAPCSLASRTKASRRVVIVEMGRRAAKIAGRKVGRLIRPSAAGIAIQPSAWLLRTECPLVHAGLAAQTVSFQSCLRQLASQRSLAFGSLLSCSPHASSPLPLVLLQGKSDALKAKVYGKFGKKLLQW